MKSAHKSVVAALLLLPSLAFARNTWTVAQDGSGDFSGIQQAVDSPDVVAGDVVTVQPGVYVENILWNGKAIRVESALGSLFTTIDGDSAGTVVTFTRGEDSGTVLEGFTIRNGTASGVSAWNSSPTLKSCVFVDNQASEGGGV